LKVVADLLAWSIRRVRIVIIIDDRCTAFARQDEYKKVKKARIPLPKKSRCAVLFFCFSLLTTANPTSVPLILVDKYVKVSEIVLSGVSWSQPRAWFFFGVRSFVRVSPRQFAVPFETA
jgi:hypothetical protein